MFNPVIVMRERVAGVIWWVDEDALDLADKLLLQSFEGKEIIPEDEAVITTALKDHAVAKVRVEGKGQFSADGQIQRIIQVDRVTLLPAGELPFDAAAKPIWKTFAEIVEEIPDEVIRNLPTDTAENHDHYIYGLPKGKR